MISLNSTKFTVHYCSLFTLILIDFFSSILFSSLLFSSSVLFFVPLKTYTFILFLIGNFRPFDCLFIYLQSLFSFFTFLKYCTCVTRKNPYYQIVFWSRERPAISVIRMLSMHNTCSIDSAKCAWNRRGIAQW